MADFFQIRIFELLGEARTPAEIVDGLVSRVLHRGIAQADRDALIEYAAAGAPGTVPLALPEAVAAGRAVLAAVLASRYFQMR